MAAGLLGAAMPQPIDDCLKTLGDLMVAGPLSAPVMSSSWQPMDLLGRFPGGESKVRSETLLTPLLSMTGLQLNDPFCCKVVGAKPPTANWPCLGKITCMTGMDNGSEIKV